MATRPGSIFSTIAVYLKVAEKILRNPGDKAFSTSYNFGPSIEGNKSVAELVEIAIKIWPGKWKSKTSNDGLHEANELHLQIDKAYKDLGWYPRWGLEKTVEKTIKWYKDVIDGQDAMERCVQDIHDYVSAKDKIQ